MAELESIVAEQRKAPVPTLVLLPEHFEMSACRKLMEDVRQRLDNGLGFVILDRLPVDAGAGRRSPTSTGCWATCWSRLSPRSGRAP